MGEDGKPIEATVTITRPNPVKTSLVINIISGDGENEEIVISAGGHLTVDLFEGDTLSIQEE